ncbi:asparagine synthase (glutamine-hydrolyzing) [Actinopolyspora mortivallis]|uniref:asparagine synthase (glutamine-hydrolyzing) n=1 Tax=Actinopolyspora mortivallis TaxID=33906 RepID=A0A2T0GTV5_ACTMO|nr:asparagine synthase (glutamine-hydrolyzing) [Actinopolyspora mortivallis]PRW62524.1 asparagine synthase (glutamine-hydrolyzing) [Actinopolyspora mortivallis]
MCGICGWVDFRGNLEERRTELEAMCDTMACRGPDAAGTSFHGTAALGHRRLAIIDLPGGNQPMTRHTPDGDVCLVYSGETYNFTALRQELRARGHRFDTDSDTEVVLCGYLEWGAALAERLNGMYAFAVWDARKDELLLVRDRMGIKPLYYYPTEHGVLFGSEPKAVLANPVAERVVDADGLREIFAMTKKPGHAVWSGMAEVEPGTMLTVNRAGIHRHTYWRLEVAEHTADAHRTSAHVRELLDDIVARQLISDVPRCVLLSGGLDSSAITALAARQLEPSGQQVRSFAVDFLGQTENFVADSLRETPDGPYVHDVAEHVNSLHQDIVLNPQTLADPAVRRAAVGARDMPVGLGDLDNSLYLLFRSIRQHSTVALSGESADEIFGGYKWFFDQRAREADTFPWMATLDTQHAAGSTLLDPALARDLDLPGYVEAEYRKAVDELPRLEGESAFERRMREISYLHLTRFVRVLLDRKDRMSMAVGLEVRVPFCDHRLVEYVFNAPWALKTHDGREKSLLRRATSDILPRSVVERVKSPYPSTQDPEYTAELQRQARELLSAQDPAVELLNEKLLRDATDSPAEAVEPTTRDALERLLDVSVWLQQHSPTIRV